MKETKVSRHTRTITSNMTHGFLVSVFVYQNEGFKLGDSVEVTVKKL